MENKLFATLDPTTRRIELPDGQPLLLTDTVGFVRNLPHRLIEAFKATLEEAIIADFLIHVLDASAPEVFAFYETTVSVLEELGAGDKQTIIVLNKIDLLKDNPDRLHEVRSYFDGKALEISILEKKGIEPLVNKLSDMLVDRVSRMNLRIPQSRQDMVALLHREGKIVTEDYEGNDVLLTAIVGNGHKHLFEPFLNAEAK